MKPQGKVIKAIGFAAIMLATVLVAMVLTGSGVSKGDNFNYIGANLTETVLVGQNVQFNTSGMDNPWSVPGNVKVEKLSDTTWYAYRGPWSDGTAYNVDWDPTLTLRATDGTSNTTLAVQTPTVPLRLKVGATEVSSVSMGTNITVDTGGINLFDADKVDLVIMGPDGQMKTNPTDGQVYANITVSALKALGISTSNINTTGWKIGSYTFQVKTKAEYACGLNAQSDPKSLSVINGTIAITAEKPSAMELETVKLTVTGVAGRNIWIGAYPSPNYHVIFPVGVNDNPNTAAQPWWWFNHTIDADGMRTYAVQFNDTGSYTIKVIDFGANGVFEGTYANGVPQVAGGDDLEATVDISVSEKAVTFDVPSVVVIGQKLTIKGTANTGTTVDIAVDDCVYAELNDLVIDENKQFSKDIDTATGAGGAFSTPGWVSLKAYVDRTAGTGMPTETEDGSTEVLMVEPWLTASVSTDSVDLGDDFTISGTAQGTKTVNILIVSPKGSGGTPIDGTAKTGLCPGKGYVGIYTATASVSETDYTFTKKISVGEDVDTGTYLIALISAGADGKYGKGGASSLLDTDALCGYSISGKTQEQLREILEDIISGAGCDDLMRLLTINVGPIETLTLNPIVADVVVGNPLEVTGETSRRDGSIIWITVKGRYYELVPVAVIAKDNTFSATFDTTGAEPGTYTVRASDGYGYTAVTSANIIP